MATLREIKNRVTAVKNTSKITQAMRMVAAAKLRRAQEAITAARPFADKLQLILGNLAAAETDFAHPFFEARKEVKAIAVIVVSSDRGLCGGFNTNVFRALTQHLVALSKEYPSALITLIPVGRRASSSLGKGVVPIAKNYPDVFGKLSFSTAQDIADLVSNGFLSTRFDKVEAVYNKFISTMRQEVVVSQILPIAPAETVKAATRPVDYIFEPSRADILDTLLPTYLNIQVWRALLESNASEQAARMMAMENATNNARDLISSLQLIYNRERQATITKEMLEIVGGAEALSGQ
ncbi:F0F1 ATP synthase subunit gamma [soil metagenome]